MRSLLLLTLSGVLLLSLGCEKKKEEDSQKNPQPRPRMKPGDKGGTPQPAKP
jgi:hypothetical protein